jgi:hypothetical protein
VNEKILQKIYPFDTEALVPYRPQFLAGWRAEEYQIGLEEAWKMGQETIKGRLRAACAREVPGDTHRNLRVQSRFEDTTFKHTLLPVWIASYRFRNKVYNFMVNGQTGTVRGEAPISWWKVALAILIGLVILAVVLVLINLFGEDAPRMGMHGLVQPAMQWIGMATHGAIAAALPPA